MGTGYTAVLLMLRPWEGPGLGTLCGLTTLCLGQVAVWHTAVGLHDRFSEPEDVQRSVGQMITALLPWQAAYLMLGGGGLPLALGVVFLGAWPVAARVGRRFRGS